MRKNYKRFSILLSIVMLVCLFAPYGVAAETGEDLTKSLTTVNAETSGEGTGDEGEGNGLDEGKGGDLDTVKGGDLDTVKGGDLDKGKGGDLSKETGDGVTTMGGEIMPMGIWDRTLTLNVSPSGAGSISPQEGSREYLVGTLVHITATANTAGNYVFTHWSGDTGLIDKFSSAIIVSMATDRNLTANFKREYTVSAVSSNTTMGTVSPSSKKFDEGTEVTIGNHFTAQPKSGYEFDKWVLNEEPVDTITANADLTITGVFKPKTYTLTASVNDPSQGTVFPNTGSYDGGSVVPVTAYPKPGYKLVEWDYVEESAGSENVYAPDNDTIKVLMKGDNLSKSVTAVFEPDAYEIAASVSKAENGEDMGSISASPNSNTYENGKVVTLTATPAGDGYVFHHWEFTNEDYRGGGKVYTDGNPLDNKITVTMRGENRIKSVKAVFEQIKYSVDAYVGTKDADGNTVIANEAGIVTPQRGEWYSLLEEIFNFDLKLVPNVTITATAKAGYEFVRWDYSQEKVLGLFNVYEEKSDGTIRVWMMGSKVTKQVTAIFAPLPNSEPVAADKSYSVTEGIDAVLGVAAADGLLAGAVDADNDVLKPSVITGPKNGTLSLAADDSGAFTYTPNVGFDGIDTFTYLVNDGKADSNTATVTITVLPARSKFNLTSMQWISPTNHTYRVRNQSSFDITYTWEQYEGTDKGSDSVPNGQEGSFIGHGGTIILKVYIDEKFMYDYTKATNNQIGYNTPPEAAEQHYKTAKNTILTVDATTGLLNGATDIDGQELTAGLESGPLYGTVELNPDGSGAFTYTPLTDFVGEDSFIFTVSDGFAAVSAIAHIQVGAPDVSITKTVDKATAYAGSSVKYTITVTNTGDTKLSDVIVYDSLVDKSWPVPDLDTESSAVITFDYTIPADAKVDDTINNTATVYANEYDEEECTPRTISPSVLNSRVLGGYEESDGNLAEEEEYGGDFDLEESASATVKVVAKPSNPTRTTVYYNYKLSMTVNGEGTVSPDPGVSEWSEGSTVQLIATPAEGWKFDGWQGDAVDENNQIIMNGNKSVTAVFSLIVEETEPEIVEIEDDPIPEGAIDDSDDTRIEDEEVPPEELPKTGGIPSGVFYGLGGLIMAAGALFMRKAKR